MLSNAEIRPTCLLKCTELSPVAGRMQSRPLLVLVLCCGALPWGSLASKSILRISLGDLREGIRGHELELALRQDGALGME
jgi:hypothetical protein